MTEPPKLPFAIRRTIEAMAHGIDRPLFPGTPREIPAGTPLPLKLAAVAVGCRARRAEGAATTKAFMEALVAETIIRRESEDPRNLAVAIAIRDDPASGSSARLAAIDSIRPKEPVRARTRAEMKAGRQQPPPRLDKNPGYVIGAPPPAPPPVANPDWILPAAFDMRPMARPIAWQGESYAPPPPRPRPIAVSQPLSGLKRR
jgi:hypothetical protein